MEALWVGVDFAERHTAAVCLDPEGKVFIEDTLDLGPKTDTFSDRVERLESWWGALVQRADQAEWEVPVRVWLEDIFPGAGGVQSQLSLRMAGVLMYLVNKTGWPCGLVHPLSWKVALGYQIRAGMKPKVWAKETARVLGYEPTAKRAKQREDLCDAFLIAHWARTKPEEVRDAEGP